MDSVSQLGHVHIFSQLEAGELDTLSTMLASRAFQSGDVIFQQDDPGDRLYLVVEGTVKISIVSQDGRESDIALLQAGDCFGEMSVLDGGLRSATATAAAPTQTMTLSREDFLAFLGEHTQVGAQIIRLLVSRLRATDQMMGDMLFLDIPTRVARKLLDLAQMYPDSLDEMGRPSLAVRHRELSMMVGASREAVTRALTMYRRMGLLTTSHRKITITDLEDLKRSAAI